jgi:hypothetical protein
LVVLGKRKLGEVGIEKRLLKRVDRWCFLVRVEKASC